MSDDIGPNPPPEAEYSNQIDWDANLALRPRRPEVVTVRFVEGDYRENRV